jgi:uncharacterized protein (TIGR03437 family)
MFGNYSRHFFVSILIATPALTAILACSHVSGTSNAAPADSTITEVVTQSRPANLAQNEAELPRAYLNTNWVAPTGQTIAVAAGGNLQAAINSAKPGDVITLQAGATFTGNFKLPNKTPATSGSPWIIIRTSTTDANFPASGTRVGPANASAMPRLQTSNSLPVFVTESGTHHYRLVGLEIGIAPNTPLVYDLVEFGGGVKTANDLPRDLIVDRCYIHGNDTGIARRGVLVNSISTAVIDSHIANFHDEADAQAILGYNGPGPFKIVNNYLEATGENIMFGGADTNIPNLVPGDVEFRQNKVAKRLSWKLGHPSYTAPRWTIKNNLELKNARRVLIDRNQFEYNWAQGQDGMAILFTPRNQDGSNPWAVVEDVTFTNNIVQHAGGVFSISGPDTNPEGTSLPSRRILIRNNVFDDIDGVKWGAVDEKSDGEFLQIIGGVEHVTVDHNTVFQTGNILTTDYIQFKNLGFTLTNNIFPHNSYGIIGSETDMGEPTLDGYFPGHVTKKNVIIGTEVAKMPEGNIVLDNLDKVGFVNRFAGNYRLTAASPYRNAGTDGKDIGCNLDQLLSRPLVSSVNASNYSEAALAPESITSAFGAGLAESTQVAPNGTLPTSLGGTVVRVQDGQGTLRDAQLFFVSPTQVNYLMPSEIAPGPASVWVINAKNEQTRGSAVIERVAPGFFTADASGRGLPAGVLLRVRNTVLTYEPIARFDSSRNRWVSIPIDFGPETDELYLLLFGTGFRGRTSLSAVTAQLGGVASQVVFAGAQGNFAGLDQLNLLLPRTLAGRGAVEALIRFDNRGANAVQLEFK